MRSISDLKIKKVENLTLFTNSTSYLIKKYLPFEIRLFSNVSKLIPEQVQKIITSGVIHILRNHQGGGGFRNDYTTVVFALSNAEFDYGRGRGLETDKK